MSAAQPRFSVVIPTYNRAAMAAEAVSSALQQTFPPHEIIVVVDGSPDDTVKGLRQKFPTITVLDCDNRGISVARNRGLAAATGNWIAFLDDDDLWHPRKLQLAAEYIAAHPDCKALNNPHFYFTTTASAPEQRLAIGRDFVAAGLAACVAEAESRGIDAPFQAGQLSTQGRSFEAYLRRDRGVISSTLVERFTLLRAGGCFPAQTCNEDWTMFQNVARFAEWHTLPFRLGFTRFHEQQSTNNIPIETLFSLAVWINEWFCGRPMPERRSLEQTLQALATYGPAYRKVIAGFHWAAIKGRHWSLARQIRLAGRALLPRRRDRIAAMIPPPLVWRWEYYVRHMHRGNSSTQAVVPTHVADGAVHAA